MDRPKTTENQNASMDPLIVSAHMLTTGLHRGLSRFYRQNVRVALIFSSKEVHPTRHCFYDQQDFIRLHHQAIFRYLRENPFQSNLGRDIELVTTNFRDLLFFRLQTEDLYCQVWCVEVPPSLTPVSILLSWVRHAARLFRLSLLKRVPDLYDLPQIISGADKDIIRSELTPFLFGSSPDDFIDFEEVIDSIRKTLSLQEEGQSASGSISICRVEPPTPLLLFSKAIPLASQKHVRKLLKCSDFDSVSLLSVRQEVKGLIGFENTPSSGCLHAFLNRGFARLLLDKKLVCDLDSENFYAVVDHVGETSVLKTLFRESVREDILNVILSTINVARREKFGCTLLITDCKFNSALQGQALIDPIPLAKMPPGLLERVCQIDGAVHVDVDKMTLNAFACLLDGMAVPGEDRSKGARYNSAKRFSHYHQTVLVVVVSEDGPVSILVAGDDLGISHQAPNLYTINRTPPILGDIFPHTIF